MQSAGTCHAIGPDVCPSIGGAEGAAQPSSPALPEEPEEPASLQEAEEWLGTYDRYVKKVTELAQEENLQDELEDWIDRCTRRRRYWAPACDRLRRHQGSDAAG